MNKSQRRAMKAVVVKLIVEEGHSLPRLCRQLGLKESAVRRWVIHAVASTSVELRGSRGGLQSHDATDASNQRRSPPGKSDGLSGSGLDTETR